MVTLKVRPELTSFIKTVCEEQQIKNFTVTDVKTNKKGEGYLGEIFMISVIDNNTNKKLNVIIKAAFKDENVRNLAPIELSFKNEIYFYQHVNTTFKKLEEKHKVRQHPEIVPCCFKTETGMEMLALENLKVLGFEIFDMTQVLDHDHIELIFKTYGRFHAYSFALRDQNLEEYTKLVGKIENIFASFLSDGFFGEYLIQINRLVQSTLIAGEDDEVIKAFKKYEENNIQNILKSSIVENCDYSAILHGDCWSNNMLFQYKKVDGRKKPCEIRLIDFQIIKTGSPICDLSYCLYSGTIKDIYKNLSHYSRVYYESFSSFLRELGSDPEKLFPFTALQDHWKKYSKFGMIMSFMVQRTKLADTSELKDFTDGYGKDELLSSLVTAKCNEEEYSKRMRELLWHMYENGAL